MIKLNKETQKLDALNKEEIDEYISDNKSLRDVFFNWIDVTQENLSKLLNKKNHASPKTKGR